MGSGSGLSISAEEAYKRLKDPFDPSEVKWRVQQSGISSGGKPWVLVLAYISGRAVQNRLDEVFTGAGWRDEYKEFGDGVLCGITAFLNHETLTSVTKWDGASSIPSGGAGIDTLKTLLSNAEKRAAVKFGIGRYLYELKPSFATCTIIKSRFDSKNNYASIKGKNGERVHVDWTPPELPIWALPHAELEIIIDEMKGAESLAHLKSLFSNAVSYAKNFGDDVMLKSFVAVKDKVKERIEKEAEEIEAKKVKEVNDFILGIKENYLDGEMLESELTALEKTIGKKVTDMCLKSGIVKEQYTEVKSTVKEIFALKLKEIKNKQ